jgi:hypothetical protein
MRRLSGGIRFRRNNSGALIVVKVAMIWEQNIPNNLKIRIEIGCFI